jgi:hypothetical protein
MWRVADVVQAVEDFPSKCRFNPSTAIKEKVRQKRDYSRNSFI